jgi:hypothetical protein
MNTTTGEYPYMYPYMKILNDYNEQTTSQKKRTYANLRGALKKATKDFVLLRYYKVVEDDNDELLTALRTFLKGVGKVIGDPSTDRSFFCPNSNKVGLDLLLRSKRVADVFGTDGQNADGQNAFLVSLIAKARREQGGKVDDAGLAWLYLKGVLSKAQMTEICTDILDTRTRKHVSLLSGLALIVPPAESVCPKLEDQLVRFAALREDDNTDENTTGETALKKEAARMGIRQPNVVDLGEALTWIDKDGDANWVWFLTMYFYQVRSPV